MIRGLAQRASEPVSARSLAVFRILFGLMGAISAVRFLINDWVTLFFETPRFFFSYPIVGAVPVLPAPWLKLALVVLVILAVLVTLGAFYRISIGLYFLLFTYIELIDLTNYLNHYYLVSVLSFLMIFLPMHACWSVDAWRTEPRRVTRLSLWVLRAQVGIVYVFAGVAKMTSDWLLHGQPLSIWLAARTEVPVVGLLFDIPEVVMLASWVGMLHDLFAPLFLSLRKTRALMYALLVLFHVMTHLLFNIGMFPLIMVCVATIFFEPDWPSRLVRLNEQEQTESKVPSRPLLPLLLGVALLVQAIVPLRAFAYGGNVLWHEQGMRFSWRVMCREKNGSVTFRVKKPGSKREKQVHPRRFLTPYQEREMASQPDMILQLAKHIAHLQQDEGKPPVQVRVDALVSLNGRAQAPMIDPTIDLTTIHAGTPWHEWILAAPTDVPRKLQRPR